MRGEPIDRRHATASAVDTDERRFYIVMQHLATVLWMKELAVEGLDALSAVLERAGRRPDSRPRHGMSRRFDSP